MCEHGYIDEQSLNKEQKNYSLCENIFISFIITFASGALCFENYVPESFISMYRTVMFIVCIAAWLWLSFLSGVENKWGYEIFAAVFWLLPQLIMYLSDNGPEFCTMSVTLYLLSESFRILFAAPDMMADAFGTIPPMMIMIIITVLSGVSFFVGKLLSQKLKNGNYTFLKC